MLICAYLRKARVTTTLSLSWTHHHYMTEYKSCLYYMRCTLKLNHFSLYNKYYGIGNNLWPTFLSISNVIYHDFHVISYNNWIIFKNYSSFRDLKLLSIEYTHLKNFCAFVYYVFVLMYLNSGRAILIRNLLNKYLKWR